MKNSTPMMLCSLNIHGWVAQPGRAVVRSATCQRFKSASSHHEVLVSRIKSIQGESLFAMTTSTTESYVVKAAAYLVSANLLKCGTKVVITEK